MGFLEKREFGGRIDGNRIVWEGDGEVVWLEPYGRDSFRFRASRSLHIDEKLDWTLLPPSSGDEAKVVVRDSEVEIINGAISAVIDGDGVVCYKASDGRVLLEEHWLDLRVGLVPQRRAREYRSISSRSFAIDVYFRSQPDEHFYGLGQEPNDCFDLKGAVVELCHKNTKCTIPYIYSSRGYGFLWNNPAIGRVELATNQIHWRAEAAQQIDYIIMAGDTPAAVLERFTEYTGRAPRLPEWAAGFWQSKLRYETQAELLEVAREYNRRNIPLDVIVIDYFHWTQQGDWKFDPTRWPDPGAMVEELSSMGTRVMVSVWPTVDARSENYDTMMDRNYTLRAESGVSVFLPFLGYETFFDATHPGARQFLWDRIYENYYQHGIRMFWLDEAEPEFRPYDYHNVRCYAGNGLEVSNLYPFDYARTFYEGMRDAGQTEIVNLVRCAWLGSQRLGVVLWSGDIPSTFDSLRQQIKAGLHAGMSGIPWWTTDIGGFLSGDPEDEVFRELVVRWFQFGVFCPILRLHGYRLPYPVADFNDPAVYCESGGPNEIWSFGEEAYGIIANLIQLRERLKPYILHHLAVASETGAPLMRPLLFDFPGDPEVYEIGDEFLFGPDLLVAPVIEYGARQRLIYLPVGADWKHVSSGECYQGGDFYVFDAPLSEIPLFLRDEALLPIIP